MEINPKATAAGLIGAAAIAATLFLPFEGWFHVPYFDPPGIATDCAGHTKGVRINTLATDAECEFYLGEDTKAAEKEVEQDVRVHVSERTKAAFISFVYNMGGAKFRSSTMLKKLNSGDIIGACNQLTRWVYSGHIRLNGLIRRRESEKMLCLSGMEEK